MLSEQIMEAKITFVLPQLKSAWSWKMKFGEQFHLSNRKRIRSWRNSCFTCSCYNFTIVHFRSVLTWWYTGETNIPVELLQLLRYLASLKKKHNCLKTYLRCFWVVLGLKNTLSITFHQTYIFLFFNKKEEIKDKKSVILTFRFQQ